jgi:hypothetical protein
MRSPVSTILYHSPPALTCVSLATVSIPLTRGRVDVADAPFGGLRILGGAGPGRDAHCKEETLHALPLYNAVRRNRNALPTTLTDDSAIAAAAMIGDSKMPKVG